MEISFQPTKKIFSRMTYSRCHSAKYFFYCIPYHTKQDVILNTKNIQLKTELCKLIYIYIF